MGTLNAALRLAGPALLLAGSGPSQAQERTLPALAQWQREITEASARFAIPVAWISRVMAAESGGHLRLHGLPITSPAGAKGLMQLMPRTWAEMRARFGLGNNPHDPRDNILAGTAYLRMMYDRFGYPGLFGAYNAGPARYRRALATGQPLPAETRAYLASVAYPIPGSGKERQARPSGEKPTLFAVQRGVTTPPASRSPSTTSPATATPAGGLFALRITP